MIRVVLHAQRLAFMVWVHECGWYKIVLAVDTPVVAESKRPVPCFSENRSPEVDYLVATLEEFRGLIRRGMTLYTDSSRSRRLINVHERDRLTLLWTIVGLPWTATSNG